MNCQDINKLIYEYCDGEVSPEEYTNISQHLNCCANCQHMYQLTLIESDILREKVDIPELSSAFTSLVMSSLTTNITLNHKSRFSRFNRKIWLSSLTTVAAVVALFLYLPHQSYFDSKIFNTYNASIQEQSSSSSSNVAYDSATITGQANLPDSTKLTEPKDTTFEVSENIAKSVPKTKEIIIQPLVLGALESSLGTKQTTAPESSRSIYYDRATASSNISLLPQNIPDKLKFVQVNNNENMTIYNYASLDGTEYLQLTLMPYSESTLKSKEETAPLPQNTLTLSRDIQIAEKKMTIIVSGNLTLEEMTSLADTIQFQDTSSN